MVLATVFSKSAMEGALEALMAVMLEIIDRAEELVKKKYHRYLSRRVNRWVR